MCRNYGGWCDTFFCVRDIRRAISIIGMFSLVTSLVQILVTVAVFTGLNSIVEIKFDELQNEEKLTGELYIALACVDFLVILFAIVMLYGNERTDEINSRKFLIPWAILIILYVMYETAINIYYFINQIGDKYNGYLKTAHLTGFIVVPFVYWILKDIFLFVGFVFVVNRIRALTPRVEYVHEEPVYIREPVYAPAPPTYAPAPAVVVKPSIVLPTPVQIGGGCGCTSASSGNRCHSCAKPTPLYGYAGPQASSQPKTGFTTSIYSR